MNKKNIGNTDLSVAPIVFGGNVFGWTLNEQESFKMLDSFAGAGYNFIDTADMYSVWVDGHEGGESETIIGNWMKQRNNRDQIIVATKVGGDLGNGRKGVSAAHIKKAAEDSLRRLQTDHIDLYYTHFDDEDTPLEETLGAYQELIQAGKVRYIAASNMSPERLQSSLELAQTEGFPAYQALQPHYNLLEREKYEAQLVSIVQQYNLSVFPYWVLAAGFLTGKYRSEADLQKSVRGGGVKKYLNEKGLSVLQALDEVAAKHQTTLATISMAWVYSRPGITAPIASATKPHHLQALFEAPEIKLDQEDLNRLNQA